MEKEGRAGKEKNGGRTKSAALLKEGNRHIGNCGLEGTDPTNRNACFGIFIGEPDARCQGYGTEATKLLLEYGFQELNLHRIYLTVFSFNDRARRSYEKAGFVLEGTRREDYYRHGRYHGTHVMGILKSEWEGA